MTTQTCERGGTHQLPAGEDSWNSERCDTLVAAGLDKCLPCQDRLTTELSATLTDDFGKLFTTWVMQAVNVQATVGGRMPDTALELFGPNGGSVISPPSRRALRGVRLPSARTPNAGPPVVGFSFDTKKAVEALTAMKPAEREAVLNDVLDGIVGAIGTGTAAPAATVGTMTTDAPVYVLIHPDGRAEWGDRIAVAEKALGPHGIGRAFLTDGSRLRIAMSDCALVLRDEYEPNPYAAVALAHVAGVRPEDAPETRGPVALFGYDPLNEWDNTRPLTADERALITRALTAAGCTTAPPTRP